MIQIASVLLGLAGGLAGWFAANFLGKSLVLFFELRALTHEEMLFSADLNADMDRAQYNASAERLRRIASRLRVLAETAPPPVRGIWSFSRYNPGAAADAVVGYAYSYDPAQRYEFRSNIEKALRFRLWRHTPGGRSNTARSERDRHDVPSRSLPGSESATATARSR